MTGDRVLRGTVTRTTAAGAFVTVPKLGAGTEYGPCERLDSVVGLAAGDRVLLATVAGVQDDLVVLGVLS